MKTRSSGASAPCSRRVAGDCDLAFEYSSVRATIDGPVRSVKNPCAGSVTAESFGEVIFDENARMPGSCELKRRDERACFSA